MPNPTRPRQFRLTDDELDIIDRLAATMAAEPEIRVTRTDVIRVAIRELAERRLPKGKPRKKS
jgi:hypothetical protein